MQVGKSTDLGRVRMVNQDSIYACECATKEGYAIVADGMGGHKAGEVASELAITTISSYINSHFARGIGFEELRIVITQSFFEANDLIYRQSAENPFYSGMGTTATLCFIVEDKAIIAHVGDSRAYKVDGEITQITKDHSLIEELMEKGELTPEEALIDMRKNVITRALGTEKLIFVDVKECDYHGETILLCSDGLTNHASNEEILQIIQSESDLQNAAEQLICFANDNGGNDNISVVLLKI